MYMAFFRSKGSVNWQESTNKNVVDTKLQETRYVTSLLESIVEVFILQI